LEGVLGRKRGAWSKEQEDRKQKTEGKGRIQNTEDRRQKAWQAIMADRGRNTAQGARETRRKEDRRRETEDSKQVKEEWSEGRCTVPGARET
jgi:hypothetical protein